MSPDKVGVITAALFAPRNLKAGLVMLGVSFVSGSAIILAIGAAIYGVLVMKTAIDPEFERKALAEASHVRGEGGRTARLGGGQTVRLKGQYLEMKKKADGLLEEMQRHVKGAADPFLREQMEPLLPDLSRMVSRIETLCASAQGLESARADVASVKTEIAGLESRLESAEDEQAREHYRQALEQKKKVEENEELMNRAAERMDAELISLGASLETFRSDLVRMSIVGAGSGAGDEGGQVKLLTEQWTAIEATVNELESLRAEDRKDRSRQRVR